MGPIIKKPRSFIGKRYIGLRNYTKIVEIVPSARGVEGIFVREVAEVGFRQGFGVQRFDRRKSKAAILNEKWRCRYTALKQGTVEKATGHCLLSASQGYHTWGTKFYDPGECLSTSSEPITNDTLTEKFGELEERKLLTDCSA